MSKLPQSDLDLIASKGIKVKYVQSIWDRFMEKDKDQIPDAARAADKSVMYNKIFAWEMTEYDWVQYVDADVMPTGNMDLHFKRQRTTFIRGWMSPLQGAWYLLKPDKATFRDLACFSLLAFNFCIHSLLSLLPMSWTNLGTPWASFLGRQVDVSSPGGLVPAKTNKATFRDLADLVRHRYSSKWDKKQSWDVYGEQPPGKGPCLDDDQGLFWCYFRYAKRAPSIDYIDHKNSRMNSVQTISKGQVIDNDSSPEVQFLVRAFRGKVQALARVHGPGGSEESPKYREDARTPLASIKTGFISTVLQNIRRDWPFKIGGGCDKSNWVWPETEAAAWDLISLPQLI
eukprot:CAMPEP_0172651470 /NCGR_PEP_ID=MMETSP1068-20121228/242826_1 /TAXON_ID=35684 /ORGANISM="Pseudopedinella elastica, Strain CCMP716" /LENGTH=342 /DNA_ID=CAMNT_0013465865 /DNA_START=40 /DNA_END=1068 /DNA_ORIENTATION=-